jgi:kojibiose phosphorylase
MTSRAPIPPTWGVREAEWQPERNEVWESLFTVGNGYLGLRGFPEEPFDAGPTAPSILVAGVFDPDREDIPELAPTPNFLSVEIELDGQSVRMATDRISEYERVLDMKRGLLHRSFTYRDRERSTRLEFERFASLADPHLIAQSIAITPLDWSGKVTVRLWTDAPNPGPTAYHLRTVESRHVARDRVLLLTETKGTNIRLAHGFRGNARVTRSASPRPKPIREGGRVGLLYHATLRRGQRAVFERMVSTHTSLDPERTLPQRRCLRHLREMEGDSYVPQRRRHVRCWASRWRRADIAIDGPEQDQRAIRFAIFHLVQVCPPRDSTVSIAAKGLSGPGYRGHVFWDTEIFMLPLFTWAEPDSAQRLLDYRYRMLPGARRKARENGYEGAMFPWESAHTGDETCPRYVPDPISGRPVRMLTGELQHHISADVVYGCWEYVRATGDDPFRQRQLLVLAVETARFWASRVEHNRREGRYEIRDVIGPDEYHEHVDNNAYTNFLAAWNLSLAADEVERMWATHPRSGRLRDLRVSDDEVSHWRTISGALLLPHHRNTGLWEQHAGFLGLADTPPEALSSIGWKSSEKARMAKANRSQVLKQADVLMMMAMFPDRFSKRVRRRNWDYYEPRTTHDSSLSPSVHSIVASDLGLRGKACEYFRRSALIDLHDIMGNTDAGLHCAALGGTWYAVVRGFLGLQPGAEGPSVRPALPSSWKRVRMQVRHRGRWYVIEATGARTSVRLASE